jgi:hypothetical protein
MEKLFDKSWCIMEPVPIPQSLSIMIDNNHLILTMLTWEAMVKVYISQNQVNTLITIAICERVKNKCFIA